MKKLFGIFYTILLSWVWTPFVFSQDFDQDGVPDSVENQLLSTLAPVVYADQADDHPPLTLDYYARHVRLYWYTDPFGNDIGNTRDVPQTINLILGQMAFFHNQGLDYHYALHFLDSGYDIGTNPNEPVTWASQQAAQQGIYGRVEPIGPSRYQVQYFMVFGYNNTSAPGFCGDIEPGSHEGDWIAVEYRVEASDLNHPRIYDAIYHDHGRQIFVESPAALKFEGTHPVIYLERGVQESWPYASAVGFVDASAHPCVSANKIWDTTDFVLFTVGGEQGDYPVVREHVGNGPRFLVTNVKNVGNKAQHGNDPEVRFFYDYADPPAVQALYKDSSWYGTEYERDCESLTVPGLGNLVPPTSPPYQGKIWNSYPNPEYTTMRAWQTWKGQPNVSVNFGYSGLKSGSPSQPFSKLSEALPIVAPNGNITITAGSSGERLTIFEPCIINASGGTVTIGQ